MPVSATVHRRAHRRGVTVFELVAAGSFLGLSALGYMLLVAPQERSRDHAAAARTGERLAAAAAAWRGDNGEACPTVSQLVHDGYLDARATAEDPWGNRLRVVCRGSSVDVVSAGPDGDPATRDDLRFGSP